MEKAGRWQVAVSAPGTGGQVFVLARSAQGKVGSSWKWVTVVLGPIWTNLVPN